MVRALRIVVDSMLGLIVGGAVVFIAVASSLAIAFVTQASMTVPGLISIWAAIENGAPALHFDPSLFGMIVLTIVIAALYAGFQARRSERARA